MKSLSIALLQQKYRNNILEVTKDQINMASKNAELVVLQELHAHPYFCQSENVDNFILADSFLSHIEFFSTIAKDNKIVLVASLFERRTAGLYHNTAVVFERDGSIAGKYRKMHIPDDPQFYEKFYFTPGDIGFNPIKTSVGNLGVLVCWDQWFPEAARIMSLNGADILIYPTAIGWIDSDSIEERERQLDAWITIQRSHAIANGLPLISVNRVGFEKDLSGKENGINFFGNSFVSGPQGEILKRGSENEEIIYCQINFERVAEVRNIWPFLRDRRIDFYKDLLLRYK